MIPYPVYAEPPEGMTSRAWLRHCMHTAQTRTIAPPAKADFLAGMSLLSGLMYTTETISDIISKEGMMDLMRESSSARYLTRQGVEQGLPERHRRFTVAQTVSLRTPIEVQLGFETVKDPLSIGVFAATTAFFILKGWISCLC